jgi:myo-inositol-1(or 4)-monophosphatase
MSAAGPFERELKAAVQAAAAAAALLSARTGADRVREKGRADLVTDVDEAAERVILDLLRREFPDDLLIAEESSGQEVGGSRRWMVDPVDGTVNYVHSHPFACVSIAFADESGPAVGVIHAPFLGEVFHATRGGGAWLNGSAIHVSQVQQGAAGLFATGFPFRKGKGDPEAYFRLIARVVQSSHGVRRAGSAALDLAYVAAGRLDGFFEIGLSPWDVAAGILVVAEAGGTVAGWPGDTSPPLETGRIIASNGQVHDWLEGIVAEFVNDL